MKLHSLWLAAAIITPAFAIDAPVDDAPPPPLLKKDQAVQETPQLTPAAPQANAPQNDVPKPGVTREDAPAEKTAFLGLVTAEVPDILAEHLQLKIGEGIMVRALMPEGPAAKSGVAVHDIILRVAGETVGNPADLSQQIARRKIGEVVQLDLIHQGQQTKIDVTLCERPPQVAASAPTQRYRMRGLPTDQAEQLRGMLEQQQAQDPEQMIQQMRERMSQAFDTPQDLDNLSDRGNQPDSGIQSQATIRVMDDQGSVEVKSKNGAKEVTVHDQAGAVVWTGPWNTEQEQSAAPQAVRERISKLNIDQNFQGNGLRFKLSPESSGQR